MYVTYALANGMDGYVAGDSKYTFKNTNVQANQVARVLLNILFVASILVAGFYYRALKITYGDVRAFALPEQRWQLFYMAAVIMFQNPFYCVIMWIEDPPVSVTYITYVIGKDNGAHLHYTPHIAAQLPVCLTDCRCLLITCLIAFVCLFVNCVDFDLLKMRLHKLLF